ncbi:MAG: zinc ABC transporter substrate-binding protein, partial [Oscillospiraceae bacterium]|nr:zinc ABC transporter substrate-binding protein [Oscillospiraceae bacterium]
MRNIKLILLCVLLALLLCSCNAKEDKIQIAATTLPVYEFTEQLCQNTNISVIQLVTEQVSCLHDYSLQVRQMQTMEESDLIVISGAGLEHFLEDALTSAKEIVDASQGITLLCSEHEDAHDDHNGHSHNEDPHIWLSPKNALVMVENITNALIQQYPHYEANFLRNKATLDAQLLELSAYGQQQLSGIQHRELITFHDGFAYFADEFNLTILHTVEEESG